MEICKVPTLRLKALNKHTRLMYIEMENFIKKKKKILTRVFKHYARDVHPHTVQTDRSEGQHASKLLETEQQFEINFCFSD